LTIKDKKSAAKFHYIKTVSGKVVAQSIAFRVVSIYWQGYSSVPLDRPPSEARAMHTLRLIALQPWEISKKVSLQRTCSRKRVFQVAIN